MELALLALHHHLSGLWVSVQSREEGVRKSAAPKAWDSSVNSRSHPACAMAFGTKRHGDCAVLSPRCWLCWGHGTQCCFNTSVPSLPKKLVLWLRLCPSEAFGLFSRRLYGSLCCEEAAPSLADAVRREQGCLCSRGAAHGLSRAVLL